MAGARPIRSRRPRARRRSPRDINGESVRPDTAFSLSSKGRLTDRDLERFPGTSLLDRLARAVCHAGCLPRKELYEAWEMARRVRRVFRGGRIVDLAGGHGLLAHVLLILDNSSSNALIADTKPQIGRAHV